MGKESAISDEQWWASWSGNGYNATEAYLSLRPHVERTSASDLGSKRHAKFKEGNTWKHFEDQLQKNVDQLLESKDEKIKLSMTKDILDRSKGKAKEKLELSGSIQTNDYSKLTKEELERRIASFGKRTEEETTTGTSTEES